MTGEGARLNEQRDGFLRRLREDVRGNAISIMAAALIPLAGMVGGGIDLARMYVTKTRMQHACDAGALAGRKLMGGGQWTQNSNAPNAMARRFFAANFRDGSYGSTDLFYSYSETAGKVSGTASVVLPMTLTRVIGQTTADLDVRCEAEMRLPNTDVMFVLDNTGSMNSKAKNTDSQTKMEALKSSVKCFYEILARLDTTENCLGGAPSGGTSSEVQIRFGFVPYDMNVNVGRILPSNWFVDSWRYQSRTIVSVTGLLTGAYVDGTKGTLGNWSNLSATTTTEADCKSYATVGVIQEPRSTTIGLAKNEQSGGAQGNGTWDADSQYRDAERQFVSWKAGKDNCKYKQRTASFTRTFTYQHVGDGTTNGVIFKAWRYKPVTYDLTPLKDGNGWKSDYKMTFPTGNNYVNANVTWDGCIEERGTVRQTSYSPIPSDAHDLDINSVPTSNATRWAPAIDDIVFPRKADSSNSSAWSDAEITTFTNFSGKGYSCVVQAEKLKPWSSASDFESYVNKMTGVGNTYHDIGMIWGARLLSPTGLFRSENEYTSTGGKIQRHLIFMTDGDACTNEVNYQAYGIAWYERRQTDPSLIPTSGCSVDKVPGTLTDQVNARMAALCSDVKNMPDTTLWVIWFDVSKPAIEANLKACASPERFFAARDAASLQTTFRQIANQISQLRVTS